MKYFLLAIACCLFSSAVVAQHQHPTTETKPAALMPGLGNHHHPVSTRNAEAQRFFDQGLTLIYAFNHEEAARSFTRAAELDPQLAMAYWGIALAVGPNYNEAEVDTARVKAADDAMQKAASLAAAAPELERAYIAALAKRFSSDPKADFKKLAVEYKDAMKELVQRYPDDLDAAVLYAESLMDLHPWQLWTKDGKPTEGTEEIVAVLEAVLKRDPQHIGAIISTFTRSRLRASRSALCRAPPGSAISRPLPGISSTCRRTSTSALAITQPPPKATKKQRRRIALTSRRQARKACIRRCITATTSIFWWRRITAAGSFKQRSARRRNWQRTLRRTSKRCRCLKAFCRLRLSCSCASGIGMRS